MTTSQEERPRLDERGPSLEGADDARRSRSAAPLRSQVVVASSTNLLAGIWLICAPFALTYTGVGDALWNDIVLGATIATLAACRVYRPYRQTWLSWTNAGLGCWLVAAPFALSYSSIHNAVDNDIVVGLIVLTFGIWSATATRVATLRR